MKCNDQWMGLFPALVISDGRSLKYPMRDQKDSTVKRILLSAAVAAILVATDAATTPFASAQSREYFSPAEDSSVDVSDLGVDIARRTILSHYPQAGKWGIETESLKIRRQGDVLHLYVCATFTAKTVFQKKQITSNVFATLIANGETNRIIDMSYDDDYHYQNRVFNRTAEVVSYFNREFERRDPLKISIKPLSKDQQFLGPRERVWMNHPLRDDRQFHISRARFRGDE